MDKGYDLIVVGAGCVGLATTYAASKDKNLKCLLLDQYEIGNKHGASFGKDRGFRLIYEDDFYTNLALQSFQLWNQLAEESGEELLIKNGILYLSYPSLSGFQNRLKSLESNQIAYEEFTPDQIREKFPQFSAEKSMKAIYQAQGGTLQAELALQSLKKLSEQAGAEIFENTEVLSIDQTGPKLSVHTAKGNFIADKLVLASGAWTKSLAQKLGLELPIYSKIIQYAHLEPEQSQLDSFSAEQFPSFIVRHKDEFGWYGLPLDSNKQVKVGGLEGPRVEPESRFYEVLESWPPELKRFLKATIPALESAKVHTSTCFESYTSNYDFLIDYLPGSERIAIAAGFSGHGFKFTPALGKIVAELIVGSNSTPTKFRLPKEQ